MAAVRSDDPSSITMMSASRVDASRVSTVLQITVSSLYAGTRPATPAAGRPPLGRRGPPHRRHQLVPRLANQLGSRHEPEALGLELIDDLGQRFERGPPVPA